MFRALAIAAVLAGGVTSVAAQTVDPAIPARQEIYKGVLAATRPVIPMLRGQAPVDIAVVQNALRVYQDASTRLAPLFPPTSQTGGDTEALPAIWQRKSEFDALMVKWGSDARAASTAITDEATFRANFGRVVANCQACHDTFRKPQ
jgi:cytochrome c556